jgi:hypothetical protein
VYSNLALFLDISKKLMEMRNLIKQMEMSMLKRQMEKSMPKSQMEKTIDYDPLAFDISPTGKNSFYLTLPKAT